MTNGPQLRLGSTLLPGVLAVALFGAMAVIVLNTGFGEMTGYPEGVTITSEIGYALLDLTGLQSSEGAIADTEPFLVSFLLIAIVLDAALDASLVLAKREEHGEPVAALSSAASPDSATTPGAGREDGQALADGGDAATDADDGAGDEPETGESAGGGER